MRIVWQMILLKYQALFVIFEKAAKFELSSAEKYNMICVLESTLLFACWVIFQNLVISAYFFQDQHFRKFQS